MSSESKETQPLTAQEGEAAPAPKGNAATSQQFKLLLLGT